jgi:nitrite reductase/ring-hydroxylating ferredoxin subunit/DMSO/TMAO reductase YedYZ heme-binding membrane subunit
MSHAYRAIQWNRHKRGYDLILAGSVALTIAAFIAAGKLFFPPPHAISDEILLLRALAVTAFLLLHVILCIGPLARLSPRFTPLLYNRRHLGVTLFILASAHAALATIWYHGFGNVNPLTSLLTSNPRFDSLSQFPYEILGLLALLILFLLAATSHDFWLHNLAPRVWKTLHMGVYPAYALIVMHVLLGALQTNRSPILAALVFTGVALVAALHLSAAGVQARRDRADTRPACPADGWIDVAALDDIPINRAVRVILPGAGAGAGGVAVFRHGKHGELVHAVSNVCAHQMGPLAEGKIIDHCITCPWHGYQYRPDTGQSPPPYTQRIATYPVQVRAGRVFLHAPGLDARTGEQTRPLNLDHDA